MTTNAPLNIFNGTNRPNVTGADWRAPIAGDEFNPAVDRFLDRAAFVQPVGQLGNAPRINPDVRRFWNLTENVSLAKSIKLTQTLDMDIRGGSVQYLQPRDLGRAGHELQQQHFRRDLDVRPICRDRLQFGLKFYW